MFEFLGSLFSKEQTPGQTDAPTHTAGTNKGEEWAFRRTEPGRRGPEGWRSARDSTSINPEQRAPIDPRMPEIPPA